jgi:hypothetical protein
MPLGTAYPLVADRIAAVARAAGDAPIVVDATGVGRAVVDLLRERGFDPIAVTLTGGKMVRWTASGLSVPRHAFFRPLEAAMEANWLRVASPDALEANRSLVSFLGPVEAVRPERSCRRVLGTMAICWWPSPWRSGPSPSSSETVCYGLGFKPVLWVQEHLDLIQERHSGLPSRRQPIIPDAAGR